MPGRHTEPMKIQTLIVDDMALARERVRMFLEEDEEIAICGECENGCEAVITIQEKQPDLVFLDVQMPELDGFGVIETVGADRMPAVIFVTAYDQYALKAFESHALDYLLKPFDRDRFQAALHRAKILIQTRKTGDLSRRLLDMLGESGGKPKYVQRVVVKSTRGIHFLKLDEVQWIESSGNYLDLHTADKTHLIRETLNRIEIQLDPNQFLRVNRSTIVNLDFVKEIQPFEDHDYVVIMQDGTQHPMSRSNQEKLNRMIGKLI